jgi:hypothetical protein
MPEHFDALVLHLDGGLFFNLFGYRGHPLRHQILLNKSDRLGVVNFDLTCAFHYFN